MKYQGGKFKISRYLAEEIQKAGHHEYFVSLFCGSCAVESRVRGFDKIICNDKHEYLIELFKGLQSGYELPDEISEEQWRYIRDHKDEDKVLAGFVGFECSFGGRWFQGYARNSVQRKYAAEGKRSLLKSMEVLKDATFTCQDYRDVFLPEDCVVYADPPYNGTSIYRGQERFDSEAFWEYMRLISDDHTVFISEQNAPDDFVPIWEKQVTRTLDRNKQNQFKATEKLFVHENVIEKLK